MIGNKRISLIVPCKNEARIIGAFVKRVPKYVDEIIVVDNNSTDNSAQAAQKAGAIVIRETRHIGGIGYGFAHLSGMKRATGDYIVAMDSDDTYPVRSIKSIIRSMESRKLDFVSCNRLPLKSPMAISSLRRFGIAILNLETYLLYGYPIQDILTGMWIMNAQTKSRLHLTSGDWNLSPEIKLAALESKVIRFGEYHIDHFERKNEISKQNLFRTGVMHAMFILARRFSSIAVLFQSFGNVPVTIKEKFATAYSFFL